MADSWYQDKVVLITGASSGIGRATAQLAANRGARVVLVGRTESALAGAVQNGAGKDRALTAVADVSEADQVKAAVDQAVDQFGRIDVAISNAGVEYLGPADSIPLEQIETMIRTNFFGLVHVTQAVIPVMRRQNAGTLVYVSSPMSRLGFAWSAGYAASKAAGDGFMNGLAHELGNTNVKVVRIYPGGTNTDISRNTPADRTPAWYVHGKITADDAARGLLDATASGKSSKVLVANVRMLMTIQRLLPPLAERMINKIGAVGPAGA
jgi:NAD(P)-dependent dehydrogenase (short-subunit alcohol dehydrogenase family)